MPCEILGYGKDCFSKNAMFCDEIQHCKLTSNYICNSQYNVEMWSNNSFSHPSFYYNLARTARTNTDHS